MYFGYIFINIPFLYKSFINFMPKLFSYRVSFSTAKHTFARLFRTLDVNYINRKLEKKIMLI